MTVQQDLTAGNGQIANALVTRAGSLASTAFQNLGSWRDEDIQRYLRQIGPALTGVKREAAKSTLAFYQEIANVTGQDFTQPLITASDIATQTLRNGVDTSVVYRRPFVDMRTALANGSTMTDAIQSGARRANYLASTEVQLARRNAGLKARSANDNIVGYVRTLTGLENCALCYVASTQRYTRGELMPIHPGCDCGEMPIYGDQDPGQVIDDIRLEAAHENIKKRFGITDRGGREIDFRKIKITEHGEMGPMLTVRGNKFTNQAQANMEPINYLDLTDDQLDEIEKAQGKKLQLTDEQAETLVDYKGNEAYLVNDALRTGNYVEDWNEQITALDNIIDEAPELDRDITVGRYLKGDSAVSNMQVGQVLEDKAYMSTSLSAKEINKQAFGGRNVRMDIEVPKGSKGLFMDGTLGDLSEIPEEREFLLPRNTKLELVEKTSENTVVLGKDRNITVYKFRLVKDVQRRQIRASNWWRSHLR